MERKNKYRLMEKRIQFFFKTNYFCTFFSFSSERKDLDIYLALFPLLLIAFSSLP